MEICFLERRLERFECSDRRLRYVRDSAYSSLSCGLLWVNEIPIGKFFEPADVPTLHGAEPVLDAGPLAHDLADTR
jgi:hypothetical protein